MDGHPPADLTSSPPDPSSVEPSPGLTPSLEREARDLVLEAFSRAKRSGKANWRQMTTAVLKNRLLQITSGGFDLRRYDADSVRDLVSHLPALLEYIESPAPGQPGIVKLKRGHLEDDGTERPEPEMSQAPRREAVRSDLWRAAMDWTEHVKYILDPATGHARPRVQTDPENLPSIHGIPKETYLSWREEFINETLSRELPAEERAAVDQWREDGGPSRVLPRHIQDGWMSLLRARVHGHLTTWFQTQGIEIPPDLGSSSVGAPAKAPALSVEVAVSVARLRETIQRCVREMTYEELRRLDIPAEVVARVIGR